MSTPEQPSARRRGAAVTALGIALVVLAYLPSLTGPFFVDDHAYVVENPVLGSVPLQQPWRFFVERTNPFEYLPVRDLSYRLDLGLFGVEPLGFRIHNLILYALCCLAVYPCVLTITRIVLRSPESPRYRWIAGIATLVFAAHPAHVESVAWISGRKELLSGLFGVLALWLFARSLETGEKRARWITGATVFFVLAVMSKSTVLPLAVVAIMLAFIGAPPHTALPRRLKSALQFASPLLLAALAGLVAHLIVGAETRIMRAAVDGSAGHDWGGLAPAILGHMARIAVFPVRLRLLYDLGDPGAERAAAYALSVAVIGAFGFGLWAIFKRRSLIGFGVVFAVVMSLPFLQLVPFRTWSLVSERFLFLPLLGLSIAVAVALAKVDPPKLRAGIAGAMFFLLLGGTFARALDWRSAETLLTENIRYSPHHHLAAEIYIDHVLDTRRYEDARRVARQVRYDRAREALKTYVDTREAKDSGDLSRARRSLDGLARGITWDSSILRLKIANLALEAGAPEVSAKVYAAVLEDRPYMPAVRYNLGLAYKQLGRKAEAVDQIELAISGGFRDGRVWNNLGLLLRDLGRTEQAEAAFLSGIAEDGRHWHAAYNLARLYIQQDRLTEGRQMLVEALARAESVGDDPSPVRALLEELDASSAPNR